MEILVHLRSTLLSAVLADWLCRNTPNQARCQACGGPQPIPPPDLVLCDGESCLAEGRCRWAEAQVLLIDTGKEKQEVLTYLVTRHIDGVVTADMPPQVLPKALAAVARGDFWLPHRDFRRILHQAGQDGGRRLSELSVTQRRIARLVAHGLTNREIAAEINRSEATVKGHVSALFRLLNVANRTQLARLVEDGSL